MQTHLCISATARAAGDPGYRTTIIRSACATRDLPDGNGGVIDATVPHAVALSELADAFATIVDAPTAWAR
ncbi:isochorismatase family protein [Sphingomonas endophytica]|uniref:isochorismatase family protein n=1 Tax=Sphingomonas endophytica TaxID=869719 RepID=UPI0019D3523C|nr:isochorismatase family protein [Sphingomonas endophytica]